MVLFLAAIVGVLVIYLLHVQTRKPDNFPPGPTRLPFIGSILYLVARGSPDQRKSFLHGVFENTRKYGSIFGFWNGRQPTVVITKFEQVRQVLKDPSTASRPPFRPLNEMRPQWRALKGTENENTLPGVLFTNGDHWKQQRKFIVGHLRDFGFGRKGMEGIIAEEVEKLQRHLDANNGRPVCLSTAFTVSVVNSLLAILFGRSVPLDDPETREVNYLWRQYFRADSPDISLQVGNLLPHPRMALLPGLKQLARVDKAQVAIIATANMMNRLIEQHASTFDPNNIRDFVDLNLKEIYNTTDPNSSFYKERGHSYMLNTMIDLFIAGSDTTAATLHWTFIYMLHHPGIKKKVQEELDKVCGSKPSLEDKSRLHYTMAVLHESMRLASTAPFALPHNTTKAIMIGDYILPENTTILPCLIGVLRDPDYFEDPDTFNPERFLTPEGCFKSCEQVIAFSVGRRACLGQRLALDNHFMFFAGIMKAFDFHLAPTESLPSYYLKDYSNDAVVRIAPVVKVIFTRRQSCSNANYQN